MAKADDTSSTIDWIGLCDALVLAAARLGSLALAKERLREWLAAGELPWSCMWWKGLDAEGLASFEQQRRELIAWGVVPVSIMPSAAYAPSDPQFWSAGLEVDWEDNVARENATCGAQAMGIMVSREHLLALLPEESREREQVRGASAWIAAEAGRMKAANEIPPDIGISDFARKLETRMLKPAAGDKSLRLIKWRSIKNRLREWGLWPVTSIK